MKLTDYFEHIEHNSERRAARRKFAADIGASESSIYSWLNGNRRPSYKFAYRIERYTSGLIKKEELRPDIYGGKE